MEQIGIVVLIALFWLVQVIVRWLRGRAAPPPARLPAPSPREAPVPDDEALFVRAPRRAPSPEPPPLRTPPPARRVGPPRRQRTTLGTQRVLRRALVLREVLGPCRAMELSER